MSADASAIVTLRIYGDSLVPANLTALLGVEPTHAHAKGDRHFGKDGREYAKRHIGMWQLRAADSNERFESRALELLARVPASQEVWGAINQEFGSDLCVGYFMEQSNEECSVTPKLLSALASRGLALLMDIYGTVEDGDASGP